MDKVKHELEAVNDKNSKKESKKTKKKSGIRTRKRKQDNGVYGLAGLEISSLRKSFNGETKYNFDDYLKEGIPEQYVIDVVDDIDEIKEKDKTIKATVNTEFNREKLQDLNESLKNNNFEINLVDHERYNKQRARIYQNGADPLSDDVYMKFHEKASKLERKFMLSDRSKMILEVDNCIELLSVLGIEVKRGLPYLKEMLTDYIVEDFELSDEQIFRLSHLLGTVTSINNPSDGLEMVLKYRLTVREIKLFLLNFIKIKGVEEIFKKEISKISSILDKENLFIEPYNDIKFDELKKHRLKKRDRNIGGVVKIKFKNGTTLLIDPISKPLVEKVYLETKDKRRNNGKQKKTGIS